MEHLTGTVFQIQRWSIHDGDGIRSTVFLKGCPLRCAWCANPESWCGDPEVLFRRDRCTSCGCCARACDSGAIVMNGGEYKFIRKACHGCGKCCKVCPTGARKSIGTPMTVHEVLRVINRDRIFYRESGGGVTFSGGEPFVQAAFLRELIRECKRLDIDTAVETSGYFDWDQVQDIFAELDCVFIDIKHMNDGIHRALTGVSNKRILANISALAKVHGNVVIRIPLMEEVNAGEQNIREMCEFIRQNPQISGVELLTYHDFGRPKRLALGVPESRLFTAPSPLTIQNIKDIIADYGIRIMDYK